MRKIAIIGTAPTIRHAPWTDPSWTVWAHASAGVMAKRVDHYFDLHPPHVFQDQRKNGRTEYYTWLKACRTPVYMQDRYPDIPASVRYPRERILAEFPPYFSSTFAWMVALALTEGATTIGCFGIHFSFGSEYAEQRAGAEFWLGVASGRGCKIVTSEGCPLLREPSDLYGYESHTPEKYAERKKRFTSEIQAVRAAKASAAPPFDPSKLVPLSGPQAALVRPHLVYAGGSPDGHERLAAHERHDPHFPGAPGTDHPHGDAGLAGPAGGGAGGVDRLTVDPGLAGPAAREPAEGGRDAGDAHQAQAG